MAVNHQRDGDKTILVAAVLAGVEQEESAFLSSNANQCA